MQSPTTPTTTRSRTSNHDAMMVDPAPTTPPPSTSMSTELTLSPPPPPRPRRPRLRVVVSSSSSLEDGHDLFLSDRLFIPNVNDEVALQATTTRSPPLVVSSSSTSLPCLEIPIVSIMERGVRLFRLLLTCFCSHCLLVDFLSHPVILSCFFIFLS